MTAIDEAMETKHPGWMTGAPASVEARALAIGDSVASHHPVAEQRELVRQAAVCGAMGMVAHTVPEGWRLVPVKPTGAMGEAGSDAFAEEYGSAPLTVTEDHDAAGNIWRAMLNAAPKGPSHD